MNMPALPRRAALALLASLTLAPAAHAQAEAWPSKPIQLVVAAPPGGPSDNFGRALADELQKLLGQPVLIDNRPGAGGQLAAEHVARAAPDGHVLMMSFAGNATAQTLLPRPNLEFNRDFTHVTQMMSGANVLVVHPSTGIRNFTDFITRVRAAPGKLAYASAGNGTSGHLAMELLKQRAQVSLVHIPYRGGAPALNDVLAVPQNAAQPHVLSGKLKLLAVSSRGRSPAAPQAPSFAELGYPQMTLTAWVGLSAPKGTPPEVIRKVHASLQATLAKPAVVDPQIAEGLNILKTTPEQYTAMVRADTERLGGLVRSLGLKNP